jgi:hypothetical protein
MAWTKPEVDLRWPQFLRAARRSMHATSVLVHSALSGETVDLTKRYDEGGRFISLDLIATDIGLSWVGNMFEARLFADELLLQQVMNYGLSFEGYLDSISKEQFVSLDFPAVFEWIFALGFSSMFSEAKAPRFVRPSFFATKVFGTLDSVQFSRARHPLPKIVNNGTSEVSLTGVTTHWTGWPTLLDLMEKFGPCTWKPGPMSASPDVILTSETTLGGLKIRLTAALAVKCFSKTTAMSKAQIEEECDKFARMFSYKNSKDRVNILFICATNYRSVSLLLLSKALDLHCLTISAGLKS